MTKNTLMGLIPGPNPLPILGWRGNMLQFFRDPITYLNKAHTYGSVAAFSHGGNGNLLATVKDCPGTIFVFGAANNQAVLSQPDIFQSSPMPSTKLGHGPTTRLLSGIFSMNGSKHRQQRRLMMPAFHKKRIETYCEDMAGITANMLQTWQVGSQRNIHADMMELTLQIACKTLFGVNIAAGDENLGAMIETWIKSNLNPLIMAKIDLPGTPYRTFTRRSAQLDTALHNILERKRNSGVDEGDVLSMLIHMRDENGEQMTEDELIGQANILFFAGHETTANALTWTIFLLNSHPDIYQKVIEEIETVLGDETPTVENIMKLELLDRVLKESLRILSPVPFLLRVAMEETELSGYKIPKGTEVIYSPYITHHMPEIYPEPERFNPDRWLTISPSAYEYLPFGAGARMCIGVTFALMEAKVVLAMMLQRYHLAMPADVKVNRSVTITMSPQNGLPVLIQPRETRPVAHPMALQGTIRESVVI